MIVFVTRSLFPLHKAGGGIARYLQVKALAEAGAIVRIVLPREFEQDELAEAQGFMGSAAEIVAIENPVSVDFGRVCQASGLFDDYLSAWAHAAHRLLRRRITADDTVLATSGGELGTLQLGAMLKRSVGCRLVYHLHDPPDHVDIDGLRVPARFPHRNRSRTFARLLAAADSVYTTNQFYADHLSARYGLGRKVSCRYIFDRDILPSAEQSQKSRDPNFTYGGNMSKVQRPELFYPGWAAAREVVKSSLTFVGDCDLVAARAGNLEGLACLPTMTRDAFIAYARASIDVGLVSLWNPYHSYCTPSKIFDYILLGTPVLVISAGGDLVDIVQEHGLGRTSQPGDVTTLTDNFVRMSDAAEREKMRINTARYARHLARIPLYSAEP